MEEVLHSKELTITSRRIPTQSLLRAALVAMRGSTPLRKSPRGALARRVSRADSDKCKCVDRYTCRTPHFHMYSHSTDHTAQITCVHGSRSWKAQVCVASPKKVSHPRVMFHFAPRSTMNTSTSSLSPTSPVLLSSSSPNPDLLSTYPLIHCVDPRQDGTSAEFHSSTGYEPKRIELNRNLVNEIKSLTTSMIWRKLVSNCRPAANH